MSGREKVAWPWKKKPTPFWQTSRWVMTLLETSCIGMNDQEPAAIINGVIFTSLNEEKVKKIAAR
jgi:NADH:ubiquinone oxidoreductase subunit E